MYLSPTPSKRGIWTTILSFGGSSRVIAMSVEMTERAHPQSHEYGGFECSYPSIGREDPSRTVNLWSVRSTRVSSCVRNEIGNRYHHWPVRGYYHISVSFRFVSFAKETDTGKLRRRKRTVDGVVGRESTWRVCLIKWQEINVTIGLPVGPVRFVDQNFVY